MKPGNSAWADEPLSRLTVPPLIAKDVWGAQLARFAWGAKMPSSRLFAFMRNFGAAVGSRIIARFEDRTDFCCPAHPPEKARSRAAVLIFALASFCCGVCAASAQAPQAGSWTWADAAARLRMPDVPPGGLYALETKFTLNVLDAVVYDASADRLSLVGHHDDRFKGPRIPYLQHLATLLEVSEPRTGPRFNLHNTPASEQAFHKYLANTAFDEGDLYSLAEKAFDSEDRVTSVGRALLPELGLFPIERFKPPGFLGTYVEDMTSGSVRIVRIVRGSPADRAGLKAGDIIAKFGDRVPITAWEFDRQIRFAGAGTRIVLAVVRNGSATEVAVELVPAADDDPWRDVGRADIAPAFYRMTGDAARAKAASALSVLAHFATTAFPPSALEQLANALQLGGKLQVEKIRPENWQTRQPDPNFLQEFGQTISARIDEVFQLQGGLALRAFESESGSSNSFEAGLRAVLRVYAGASKRNARSWIDRARSARGINLPPELLAGILPARVEAEPEFVGFSSTSLLARAMYEGDYILKQLPFRTDLTYRLRGYETLYEFKRAHGVTAPLDQLRLWIFSKIESAQSQAGTTLEFRSANMRIGLRQLSASGDADLELQSPIAIQYQNMLSSYCDDWEREYPTFHELREIAKLGAAAIWLRRKNPSFRMPAEGRVRWNGPAKLPGLVYVYLPPRSAGDQTPSVMAHGGVNLVPFDWSKVANPFPADSHVTELKDISAIKAPRAAGQPADAFAPDPQRMPRLRASAWVGTAVTANNSKIEVATIAHLNDAVGSRKESGPDNQSTSLYDLRDIDATINQLRDLIAATTDRNEKAVLWARLANALHLKGDNRSAVQALNKARELAPNLTIYKLLECESLDESGQRSAAIACLKEYAALEPANRAAKRLLKDLEAGEKPSHEHWRFGENADVADQFGACADGHGQCPPTMPKFKTHPMLPPPQLPDEITAPNPAVANKPAVRNALKQQQTARDEYMKAWSDLYEAQVGNVDHSVSDADLESARDAERKAKQDLQNAHDDAQSTVEYYLRGSSDDTSDKETGQTPNGTEGQR